MPPETFPQRLYALRKRAGLTLTELSARCGVSRQQLTRYESGQAEPILSTLLRLAEALQVPPWLLLPGWPPAE